MFRTLFNEMCAIRLNHAAIYSLVAVSYTEFSITEVRNIGHLVHLQFLDLSDNLIADLDEKELPQRSLSIVNLRYIMFELRTAGVLFPRMIFFSYPKKATIRAWRSQTIAKG
jgi:hypothetical protein